MTNRALLILFIGIILSSTSIEVKADRIYIVNSTGYNQAEVQLQTAIANNGHIVTVGASIPAGFVSTCIDPVNGYDWLCFFGNSSYTAMIPQMQAFIDNGGKVFYQYEVSCCTVSSQSAADVLTSLVGIPITPNSNAYIALGGWEATGQSCCATFIGNAYKGLDGLPLANQLQATANLNGSAPPIANSLNYGFFFTTTDFASGANQGGIIGVGDVNMWYDGDEPFSNGGSTPVSTVMVDYFFPNSSSTCYIFPPGCMTNFNNSGTFAFDLGPDTTLCTGQSLLLDVTTGGGTYLWQDNSTNATFNVTLPGQYWVEVTGNCGVGSDTINVNFIAPPTIDLGNDTSLCPGQSLLLDATTIGSTYLWQDLSVAPTYNINQQGLYWVDVSTSCGVITDSINVDFGATASVDLGNDTVLCTGGSIQLDVTFPGASYLWQDNSTSATFNVTQAGQYWAEVTSSCGVATDTIDVSFIAPQTVFLGNDTTLCTGQSLLLDATTSNSTYSWQDNTTASTFNITGAGVFWVDVNTYCGLITDSLQVYFNITPFVDLGNDTSLCEGEPILLDAFVLTATYQWQDNSTASTFSPSNSGLYWVTASTPCGLDADSIQIEFIPPPTVDLGNDTTLCPGDLLTLDATGIDVTYLWQNGATSPTFFVDIDGYYTVQVTGDCGTATDQINVLQANCGCELFIPNAFTPNGDQVNDIFTPVGDCLIEDYELLIFDRWGGVVFGSEDPAIVWDGRSSGNEIPIGVYAYKVRYKPIGEERREVFGSVTLAR